MPDPLHGRWTERSLHYDKFVEMGEENVRAQITSGLITGQRLVHARDWLSDRETAGVAERDARREEAMAAQASAATSAAEAAWVSANTAREQARLAESANRRATIAIVISITMPIITFLLGWLLR